MSLENHLRDLLEGQLADLAQNWLALRTGLCEAIGWHWGRFKPHVLRDGAWRLLRAGLSAEPENLDESWDAIERSIVPFRCAGRVPPLHFYVRQLDATPSLEIQASVPLSQGQGSVILSGCDFCLEPQTLLLREDVDKDRRTASAALQLVEPTDEREEEARQLLLAALGHEQ